MAKILVVDDTKETNDSLIELFNNEGHDTFRAFDGIEALEVLSKEAIDLMILDLRMPRMRGEEVIRRLKRFPLRKDLDIVIYSSVFSGNPSRITFSSLDTESLRACGNLVPKSVNGNREGSPSQQLLEAVNQLLAKRRERESGAQEGTGSAGVPAAASGKARILVVEDNVATSDSLKSVIEGAGYEVVVALDGQEALDALNREHIALVTLDLGLPKISGDEVLMKMRSDPKLVNIPVIVTTANVMQSAEEEALGSSQFGGVAQNTQMGNTDYASGGSTAELLGKIKSMLN